MTDDYPFKDLVLKAAEQLEGEAKASRASTQWCITTDHEPVIVGHHLECANCGALLVTRAGMQNRGDMLDEIERLRAALVELTRRSQGGAGG